jgi:hypothetical protein
MEPCMEPEVITWRPGAPRYLYRHYYVLGSEESMFTQEFISFILTSQLKTNFTIKYYYKSYLKMFHIII